MGKFLLMTKISSAKTFCILSDMHDLYDDRAYYRQALSLKKAGYDVHFLLISDERKAEKGVTANGIKFEIFAYKRFIKTTVLNYLFKKFLPVEDEYDLMLKAIKKIQPDYVQMVDLRMLRFVNQLKKMNNPPKIIYDIQEPRDNNLLDIRMKKWAIPMFMKKFYANYIQQWEYKISKQVDFIIGVDNGIEKRVKTNLPEAPYETIYNFTDLAQSRKNIPLNDRKYDFAYVGAITELRGGETIAKATKILIQKHPDVKVLLLGPIYPPDFAERITDFIKQNNLQDNLIWINSVPFDEVSDYYNEIKIGLNPLHYAKAHEEIIQIKLFEYMNYGLPIITSDFGEMQHYTLENNVGECIEPNKPELLAETMLNLYQNPEKLAFYSENGIKAVDEKYSWKVIEKKYLNIIENMK